MHAMHIHDDIDGNYLYKQGEILNKRYEIISLLGKGSFGQALKCFDHFNKEDVCIKIIKNKPKFKSQSNIEIKILKLLNLNDNKKCSNIVQLKDHFNYNSHICLVFELLNNTLYEELQNNNYCGFDVITIKKITTQILFALLLLKKHNIIHCDLKPENILLIHKGKTGVKLIDFGSSCFNNEQLYTYIQSRFYRAPEVILGIDYGVEIDMWSLGCILCELYMGYPIFPGENEYDMIYYMMEFLGKPCLDMINKSPKKEMFLKENSLGKIRIPNTKSIEEWLNCNDDKDFISFIKGCLTWDKNERLKPEDALKHKWIVSDMLKEDQKKHFQKIKDMLKAKHKFPKLTSELNTNVNAFQLLTHRFISRK